MRPLRINIVLPFLTTKPNGGAKIMYEYANRLQARGHVVTIIHSIQRPFRKIKSPVWWKQLNYTLRGLRRPPWFPLHDEVQSFVVPEITNRRVPDADIVMSTWWEMTYMINELSPLKGRKFNLIQGYETWKGHEEKVHDSYKLPVHHLVIANYLEALVKNYSLQPVTLLPNAIDTERFSYVKPFDQRFRHSIVMLYSIEPIKGSADGIQVVTLLKEQFPDLKVDLFGVYDKPSLPGWINYHKRPHNLPALMNEGALFFSPSLGEGWALPPAEAMACGCAVVCTNIGGHADYAFDHQTALLATPANVEDMVARLAVLLNDHALAEKLSHAGRDFITRNFNWERSLDKLEFLFDSESGENGI